jgi:hypothetical protein
VDVQGTLGDAKLVWWVLGSANDTISRNPNGGTTFTYTFSKNGSYRVVCGIVDKDGKILLTAGAGVTISDKPSVTRNVSYDYVFKYSTFPRTVWAFNIRGTITGDVDTIYYDSLYGNVYIGMGRCSTFTFIGTSQGSITSPLTVDTVYPDKSRLVYYYTNTGMVPDVSGGFTPRVFDVKDGNIHIESEISGDLYMDVGYICRMEQYDSTGTLVDSLTGTNRLSALKVHFMCN